MTAITLNANKRDIINKSENKKLRESGKIPAVLYGAKRESTSLSIDVSEFLKVFKEAGETSAIKLKTGDGEFDAMIHDVQYDPVKGDFSHVDFLAIDLNKPIEVSVPLEFTGVSEAVKGGGILVKVMHEIAVLGLPGSIPQNLLVDISKLAKIEDVITLADVNLPNGVSLNEEDKTQVVALVAAQQEETESSNEINLDSIEVEKKGKKEDEAEGSEK
jgi:large subunit ribosomal protein L25